MQQHVLSLLEWDAHPHQREALVPHKLFEVTACCKSYAGFCVFYSTHHIICTLPGGAILCRRGKKAFWGKTGGYFAS